MFFWTRVFGMEHITCDAEQGTDHGNEKCLW